MKTINSVEAVVDLLSKHWRGEHVVDPWYSETFRQLSVEIERIAGTTGIQLRYASPEHRRDVLLALLPEMKSNVVIKGLAYEITKPQEVIAPTDDVPTRILFVTADCVLLRRDNKELPLRLDEEQRKMALTLRLATARDRFQIEVASAARIEDLEDRLLDFQPHIFHFSGHGMNGRIILLAEGDKHREIECENLAKLLHRIPSVQLAILNACYTAKQAEAVVRHIPAVISMATKIDDDAAIDFSECFYRALFRRLSVLESFKWARASLEVRNWPEDQCPSLLTGERVDAARMIFGQVP